MRGAVAPGALELEHDVPRAIALESFVGDRGPCDVAAQAFELLALMRAPANPGMQVEAVRIGAQGCRGFVVPAGHCAQAQHLLSGARPQRDAIGARGMGPKIQAIIEYLEGGGSEGLVTNPPNIGRALEGATGRRISRA
jgi:hypothetical protein